MKRIPIRTPYNDVMLLSRTTTDCEWGHYQMVYGSHDQDDSSDTADETVENPQKSKEKQSDARVEGSKILHFKTGAPASKQGKDWSCSKIGCFCQVKLYWLMLLVDAF